jgi:transposase-like protein
VEAQPRSGLCVVDYCERHGLRRESFYRWRRVFAADAAAGAGGAAGSGEAVPSSALFAEVADEPLREDGAASGVELVLSGERRLRLAPGFDADTLRRAVSLLESLPC